MVFRKSNFKAVPEELVEAAKIDGASDARVFFSVALPLAKVGLVSVICLWRCSIGMTFIYLCI